MCVCLSLHTVLMPFYSQHFPHSLISHRNIWKRVKIHFWKYCLLLIFWRTSWRQKVMNTPLFNMPAYPQTYNPHSTHTQLAHIHTYSEMWTKMSLPPSDGVMKPWPLERQKYLHTPVNTGPSAARAVLSRERERSIRRRETASDWREHSTMCLAYCLHFDSKQEITSFVKEESSRSNCINYI